MAVNNKGGMKRKPVKADIAQRASTKVDNDSWSSPGNKKGVLRNNYDTHYGKQVTKTAKSRVKKAQGKKG